MRLEIEHALESWCGSGRRCIGQVLIEKSANDSFTLRHRDDAARDDLTTSHQPGDAVELAKFDNVGNYRPLKTAPNLRRGWRMELATLRELRHALDLFYPGRLAILGAFEKKTLCATPLRQTLERQTGMYRIAAKISDAQTDDLVGNFCRSDGGCLRTILWKRDASGAVASTKLPAQKFDPSHDQSGHGDFCIPLLCQEACALLVSAARDLAKDKS